MKSKHTGLVAGMIFFLLNPFCFPPLPCSTSIALIVSTICTKSVALLTPIAAPPSRASATHLFYHLHTPPKVTGSPSTSLEEVGKERGATEGNFECKCAFRPLWMHLDEEDHC